MREIYRRLAQSPGSSLTMLGVLLSVAIAALFVSGLETRYADRIAAAKSDALSFSSILAEHTVLTFEDVDRALRRAQAIRRSTLSGRFDSGAANAALRGVQKGSSVIVAIGWTDASGQILAHSYDDAPPRSNLSGMPHFIAQRDGAGDRLFISPPFRSAAGDHWFTAASRRLSNADGSFAGVVTAVLDQSYFTKIYRSIDLGKGGTILLLHRDGPLLAREPEQKDSVGTSLANGALLSRHLPVSETAAYETMSVVDGVERIIGYKAAPGLPLVVAVTYARSEVLRPWYRYIYTFGLMVAAVIVLLLLGTFLLVRQTNDLAAKTRALARTNARFDIAINNMSQGLCLFDADKRLVIANRQFRKMYGLPEELVVPGTSLRQIFQFYADRDDIRDMTVDQGLELVATERTLNYEPPDGRVIDIQRTPTPDGGWVATHEDITIRKRAEQLLAEKAAELEAMNVRFDAALNNMSQGLCMFDAEQKVVVSNARYGDIYHLGRDACGDGSEAPAAAAQQAASASDEKPSHVCSLLSREQVDSVIPGNDGGQDKDASEAALLKDVAMEHCQYSHIEGMNVKFLDLIIYKASSDEGFEQIRIGESAQQGSDRRLDIGDISYLKDMSAQNEMVAKASKGRTHHTGDERSRSEGHDQLRRHGRSRPPRPVRPPQ